MHLTDVPLGAMGSNAIVGAHLPIANGLAFAARYRRTNAISACFFGDGATNIGAFHEALNFIRKYFLQPENPDGVARGIAAATGARVAIVDVNDLGIAKVLGASSGVARARVEEALLENPHGNADEQTPIVVLKFRASGANPFVETAA